MDKVSTGESDIALCLKSNINDKNLLYNCLKVISLYLPRDIFDQVTAGSGWPSALQLRLTVVPALTLMVPGPLVSMILADSEM